MATTIETDLKDVLERIDKRLGSLESDMTTLKVDMATVKTELTLTREDVKDIKGRATAQIWTLIGVTHCQKSEDVLDDQKTVPLL